MLFFLAAEVKYCLTIDECGSIQEHKTFKGFSESKRVVDRSQYFRMLVGVKVIANLPLIWKRSFNLGELNTE